MKYMPDLIVILMISQILYQKKIKKEQIIQKKAITILLFFYFASLYFITLAPFRPLANLMNGLELRLNIQPYRDISYGYGPALRESFLNVILFIPFGILGMLYRPKTILKQTVHGFLLSLSIESLQILSFTRSTDITDLINNSLGAFMGACLLVFFRRLLDKNILKNQRET